VRRLPAIVLALAAALAVGGCGGGGDDGDSGTTTAAGAPNVPTAPDRVIVLRRPSAGATVRSPIAFAGTTTAYEATVNVELRDASGKRVAQRVVTATCGTGCRGRYAGRIAAPDGYEGPVTLRLFELSAEDGSELHPVEVQLTVAR
jgi:hypothetical protein